MYDELRVKLGASNGSAVAAGSDQFSVTTKRLAQLWASLRPSDVFHCDLLAQAQNSFTWIVDLSFGGILGGCNAKSLLDATPLKYFLDRNLNCDRIQDNIKRGPLYALTISAMMTFSTALPSQAPLRREVSQSTCSSNRPKAR